MKKALGLVVAGALLLTGCSGSGGMPADPAGLQQAYEELVAGSPDFANVGAVSLSARQIGIYQYSDTEALYLSSDWGKNVQAEHQPMPATVSTPASDPAKLRVGERYFEAAQEQVAAMPKIPATEAARTSMTTTVTQLQELSAAVPGAFEQAKTNYVAELRANGPALEDTFQHELNMGFVNLFWFYGASSALMLLLLLLLPSKRKLDESATD